MKIRSVYDVLKDSVAVFRQSKGPLLGAALAFYTTLSLSPLLLVIVAIADAVYGEDAARGQIFFQIRDLVGDDGAKTIESMLAATQSQHHGWIATLVSVVTVVIAATGVFANLQEALDAIWGLRPEQIRGGILLAIRDRAVAFSVVCGMAILLIASLIATTLLSGFSASLDDWVPGAAMWLRVGNVAISFLVIATFFAILFKFLPHTIVPWAGVGIGAGITSLLFTIGKELIGFYLGKAAVGSPYGAAGSFVALLMWIYYSAQIFLLGAAITRVVAQRSGLARPEITPR